MIYRFDFHANKRSYLSVAFFFVVAAVPVVFFVFGFLWIGLIVAAAAAYFDYHLLAFINKQKRSFVSTTDDGIACLLALGDRIFLPWVEVTHAGTAIKNAGVDSAFVYAEKEDRLLVVPNEFQNFSGFVDELAGRFALLQFHITDDQPIAAKLRHYLRDSDANT